MAASGYDVPQSSSMTSRYEPRRNSGSMTGVYERSMSISSHRRSPSPSTSRRGYDNYALPPRSAPVHREEPNVYRPNIYRPEYSASVYYEQPSSPNRYSNASRPVESDPWDRQIAWKTGYNNTPTWQPHPPSPTGSARSRGRDDMLATRMFEPSDNWKYSSGDRPIRDEGPSYAPDRYHQPPARVAEPVMDSLQRQAPRGPYSGGGDRYRPAASKRASYPNTRPDYDSYRPPHDANRDSRGSFHHESSPARYRTETPVSATAPPSRSWNHYEPANSRIPALVPRSRSKSPEWRSNGGVWHSPQRTESANGRTSRDEPEVPGKKELSRRSSRSSIASTQVSDSQHATPNFPVTKAPEGPNGGSSSKVVDSAKSVAPALPSSPSISSPTGSSPVQPFSGAQATLASRLKNVHSSSPVLPSPLSSGFVMAERGVSKSADPAPKEGPTEPKTNGHQVPTLTPPSRPSGERPSTSDAIRATAEAVPSSAPVPPKVSSLNIVPLPPPAQLVSPSPNATPQVTDDAMDVTSSSETAAQPSKPIEPPAKETTQVLSADQAPAPQTPGPPGPSITLPNSSAFTFTMAPAKSERRNAASSTQVVPPTEPMLEPKVVLELTPLFPPDGPPLTEKPSLANAKSFAEALRAVVMTRMVYDTQTRDDVVNPVLMANRALVESAPAPRPTSDSTPDQLIAEVQQKLDDVMDYGKVRPSLVDHFEQRQNMINGKVQHLSGEYISLQRKWRAHCATLNVQQRSTTHDGEYLLHGRTTRRTSAFTDAVRSDLEMEQVIASLGVDDLTDPNYLSVRNAATIPDMISVVQGRVDYLFDDSSHRVEDPHEYYAPHTGIDDWTEEEKRIFIDKFAMFPKQFGIIAEHIPHKTAAQCVDYYYLHKKRMIDFRKVVSQLAPNKRRRRGGGKKKGNALLADIAQHDAEVGKDHLSTFIVPSRVAKGKRRGRGAAAKAHSSTPVAPEGNGITASNTPQPEVQMQVEAPRSVSDLRLAYPDETPVTTPTPEPEGRSKRTTRKAPPTQTSTPVPVAVVVPPSVPPTPPVPERPVVQPTPKPVETVVIPPSQPEPEKPVKKAKRGRKQVKSAAIIIDEPPSPPPELDD